MMYGNEVWAYKDLGLFIMRVAIGLIFMKHGYGKYTGGSQVWLWCGQQMAHIGITFFPIAWGIAAMIAEFFGGICLTLGFYTRFASCFLLVTMIIATLYHINNNDDFSKIAHPLCLLFIFLGFIVAGSGQYSLDTFLKR